MKRIGPVYCKDCKWVERELRHVATSTTTLGDKFTHHEFTAVKSHPYCQHPTASPASFITPGAIEHRPCASLNRHGDCPYYEEVERG